MSVLVGVGHGPGGRNWPGKEREGESLGVGVQRLVERDGADEGGLVAVRWVGVQRLVKVEWAESGWGIGDGEAWLRLAGQVRAGLDRPDKSYWIGTDRSG